MFRTDQMATICADQAASQQSVLTESTLVAAFLVFFCCIVTLSNASSTPSRFSKLQPIPKSTSTTLPLPTTPSLNCVGRLRSHPLAPAHTVRMWCHSYDSLSILATLLIFLIASGIEQHRCRRQFTALYRI